MCQMGITPCYIRYIGHNQRRLLFRSKNAFRVLGAGPIAPTGRSTRSLKRSGCLFACPVILAIAFGVLDREIWKPLNWGFESCCSLTGPVFLACEDVSTPPVFLLIERLLSLFPQLFHGETRLVIWLYQSAICHVHPKLDIFIRCTSGWKTGPCFAK